MSSLDNLRKSAKRWLKDLRAGDASAHARFRRAYPQAPPNPQLRDVQRALALERGFDGWAALKNHITTSQPDASLLSAFLDAAGKGNVTRVVELLDAHPEIINERGELPGNSGRRTALHFGVGHEAVVRALLERGADPNIRDEGDNAMPLHFAAENQDFATIRLLIEHGADPIGEGDGHELDVIGWSCCWDYRAPNKEIVDYLLAHGARHHIFSAVTMGEVETIRTIVATQPDQLMRRMDRTNKRRTPLHQAVIKEQLAAAETLVELGADLEALDTAGLTALDQAALSGRQDLAELLIDRGARLHLPAAVALQRRDDIDRLLHEEPEALTPGRRYATLIVRASERGAADVVEHLIELGADVNVRDDEATAVDQTHGYTPLHAAAGNGHEETVRILLKHGADVNAREDKYGATPAGWADYFGHRDVRDLILRGRIDIFQAIEFDRTERIPGVLKRDPEALNRPLKGHTPLASAAHHDNIEAAKYLVREGAELATTPEARASVAREPAYARVVRMLEARDSSRAEIMGDARAERVKTFLRFACWDHHVHGKGDHRMCDYAAQRLLAQHPEIARDSLYAAIVCGELDEMRRLLVERPDAARERGGAREWSPLLYLTYTRFTHQPSIDHAVAMATELLDRGADPNDYYMAGHSRYSALVGVAREGEQDAPPHPRREELFQLLIDRGTNMYDIQVLYNTHFSGDLLWWLTLVHARATKLGRLADWQDPNWPMFDMGGYGCGARFLLWIAIRDKNTELARWLLANGASPEPPPSRDPRQSKESLHADAVRQGAHEIAELLRQYGARPTLPVLDGEDAFVDACLRLDRDAMRAHLERHPEFLQSPKAMIAAASRNRPDAIQLLLDVGFSINIRDANNATPLHHAAGQNAVAAARLLIERGAEIDPLESQWNATPIGWAAHGDLEEMVDFLSHYTRNVWTLAFRGYFDRLGEVLRDDPSLARSVDEGGNTPLWWLPEAEEKAVQIVDLLLSHGADPTTRNKNGNTAAEWARKRGMLKVARLLGE